MKHDHLVTLAEYRMDIMVIYTIKERILVTESHCASWVVARSIDVPGNDFYMYQREDTSCPHIGAEARGHGCAAGRLARLHLGRLASEVDPC